jgi:hypothetical protein
MLSGMAAEAVPDVTGVPFTVIVDVVACAVAITEILLAVVVAV